MGRKDLTVDEWLAEIERQIAEDDDEERKVDMAQKEEDYDRDRSLDLLFLRSKIDRSRRM